MTNHASVSQSERLDSRQKWFAEQMERVFHRLRLLPDLSTNALMRELPDLSPDTVRAALARLQAGGRVTYRLDERKDPPGKHWSVSK